MTNLKLHQLTVSGRHWYSRIDPVLRIFHVFWNSFEDLDFLPIVLLPDWEFSKNHPLILFQTIVHGDSKRLSNLLDLNHVIASKKKFHQTTFGTMVVSCWEFLTNSAV